MPAFSIVLFEMPQHLGLDVDGVHPAGGRDGPGQPPREVAGAGAEIGDDVAGLQTHRPDDLVGLLFLVASRPLQPVRARRAHDRGGAAVVLGADADGSQTRRGEEKDHTGGRRSSASLP